MAGRERADIRQFIIDRVEDHPGDIASVMAEKFGFSRQAANFHLRKLVSEGIIEAEGATKARKYTLRTLASGFYDVHVSSDLQEDVEWREKIAPKLQDCRQNVRDICQYGFCEMVNNVRDHSESSEMRIFYERDAKSIRLSVIDRGIGIFRKIKRECNLLDEHHAILELSKGKLTTDSAKHTGEGIFFTSRMFSKFMICSFGLTFGSMDHDNDWLVDDADYVKGEDSLSNAPGTAVYMAIDINSELTISEVFRHYEIDDEESGKMAFAKTHLFVNLARHEGEQLVSRSQARRILARLERFQEVMLDYTGVETIGQAFADEIYRVYRNEHPEVQIYWLNTTPSVEAMIIRARTATEPLTDDTGQHELPLRQPAPASN